MSNYDQMIGVLEGRYSSLESANTSADLTIVHSDDPMPTYCHSTIFLAGPSCRFEEGMVIEESWRHRAIEILRKSGYTGHVFVPIPKKFFEGIGTTVLETLEHYDEQIKWEDQALARADVIVFYLERSDKNTGLTTNIEFGRYLESRRMVYGHPFDAVSVRYLDQQVAKRGYQVHLEANEGDDGALTGVIKEAIERIGEGAERKGGECLVPLLYWRTGQFQEWYQNIVSAGNVLAGFVPKTAITLSDSGTKYHNDGQLFGYAAWVKIHVKAEDRYIDNEWIFSRTHASYVVPFYIDPKGKRHFVFIKEFRSPVNNSQGFVYGVPGGTSPDGDIDPIDNAMQELREETGIDIKERSRYKVLGNRQMFAAFSTSKIFAVGVQLTEEEFLAAKESADRGEVHGADPEERCKIVILTEEEYVKQYEFYPVDFTTLGILHLVDHMFEANGTVLPTK